MIGPSGNVRVFLACGVTDMRRGIDGLSALVETVIKEAPGLAQSSASAENARIGLSSYGGMARGFAYFTRFSSADTFPGRRRKKCASDAGSAFDACRRD